MAEDLRRVTAIVEVENREQHDLHSTKLLCVAKPQPGGCELRHRPGISAAVARTIRE